MCEDLSLFSAGERYIETCTGERRKFGVLPYSPRPPLDRKRFGRMPKILLTNRHFSVGVKGNTEVHGRSAGKHPLMRLVPRLHLLWVDVLAVACSK